MRLRHIHQIAAAMSDLAETKTFYQDVLQARYIGSFDPPGLLFFEFAGIRVLFETAARPATIYFWVDDIDAAFAALQSRGVEFRGAPHMIHRDDAGTFDNPGTEEWMAFFADPGGNTLAIVTRRQG